MPKEIKGLRQFQANCRRLSGEIDGLVGPALRAAAVAMAGHAKGNAPVDEGTLRSDVGVRPLPGGGFVVGVFGEAEEYAGYVEFGTEDQAPRPFMTMALMQTLAEAPGIVPPLVDGRIRGAVKSYKV
ncbi:HK97-gp10 family putative phage morphogenesis protein [Paludisphaera sp.]|uniref:HK97-gp10 family putative phage morphogenesis protein n=1 Tax=Paludisphaera sp. TaxID=2017432 RepID=UPI00301DE1A1